MSFVHLHCRSYFSLKDGAFSPEDLAQRAAELGMPAVALTDRDGLYGVPRFVAACADAGVRPILGAQLTLDDRLTPDGGRGRHSAERSGSPARSLSEGERLVSASPRAFGVAAAPRARSRRLASARGAPLRATPPPLQKVVLLARTNAGYGNLCRLITEAHMSGERGEPAVTAGAVLRHAEGLVALLGPESPPGRLALAGRPGAARELLRPWREAFGRWCFVEVRNLLEPGSVGEVRRLLRLADEAGIEAAATNAVRHLVPEDAFLADALECMREIVPVAGHHVTRWNAEGFLKPPRAMRGLFADRPEVCEEAVRIAEACEVDIGLGRVHFPEFPTPPGRSATSLLAERCHAGMRDRRIGGAEVRARLESELDLIRKMGYSAYFLMVADIVRDIKRMGVRCAARGSAAGSLVCYLTGISEVDPVRHGLLFERFLNPLRDELPDIDLDVESARREEVYESILARYGDDRCATVCMVDTYRARAAIREVGKALGYPEEEIGRVAKAFPHIGAHRIREAMGSLPELRGSNLDAGQLETLFRVAERLNGFPRHIAMHPSGIVLSGSDLVDRVPMERSFLGHRMVQADKDDVELLGLLKLDVLGVRMLSAMRHALGEIERATGERVDLDRIPTGDPATWELIRASDTVGCFQIESPGQRELLQKFQPVRFEDLIVDISLFRPGPVKSDMVTPFLRRRHGMEAPVYAHRRLRPALVETHGVIVYHEQLMRTIAAVGGYDLAQADRIRRHLDDDPDDVEEIREDLFARALARGWRRDEIARVWRECIAFASFGFCKAHAASFAVPTYQSAWLKANHPAAFLAGVLTHEPGMYPRRLILEDVRSHGIPILPLDVNASQKDYTVEHVRPGDAGEVARAARSPVRTAASSMHAEDAPDRSAMATVRAPRRRPPRPSPADRSDVTSFGIRLGLRDVDGVSDGEIDRILAAHDDRPFTSVGDFLRRAGVSRPVAEALVHVGAFDQLTGTRSADATDASCAAPVDARHPRLAWLSGGPPPRYAAPRTGAPKPRSESSQGVPGHQAKPPNRRDLLFEAMTTEAAREGEQLTLGLEGERAPPGLRDYTTAEAVRAELEVLGLDASRHLLSFYEPVLADLGVTRARDLPGRRGDAWVMVAGVKVASQTPAVRSGQRIIFLTLDDATGPVDVTIFERVQDRVAGTVFHSSLLAVWGRLRRTGRRGVSIIAEEVWDLAALDRARRDGRLAPALEEGASVDHSPRAPRKLWHSSGGSAGW